MKRLGKTLLILIIVISALSSLVVIGGAVYLRRYKNAHVDPSLIEIAHRCEKTKFYCYDFSDRDGRVGEAMLIESSELGGEVKYKYVPYNEIPENLVNAFIAIEDKRFYKHNGVDFIRTAKAAFNYVFGSGKFGGSTITQQLPSKRKHWIEWLRSTPTIRAMQTPVHMSMVRQPNKSFPAAAPLYLDLFVGENEKKLLELLDLSPIAPDEVFLKPVLLKTKPN